MAAAQPLEGGGDNNISSAFQSVLKAMKTIASEMGMSQSSNRTIAGMQNNDASQSTVNSQFGSPEIT